MRMNSTAHLGRLTKRSEFLRVARGRIRVVMPSLIVQAFHKKSDTSEAVTRLGFTASRKVGNAVARNRARRRLKAVAHDVFSEQLGNFCVYVLIARSATISRSYDELLNDLRSALSRLERRGR